MIYKSLECVSDIIQRTGFIRVQHVAIFQHMIVSIYEES